MTRPWRSGADLRRPQRAHCPTAHTPTGGRTCVRRKQTCWPRVRVTFCRMRRSGGVWLLDFWYGLMPRPFPSRMFYGFPVISASSRAALLRSSSFPKIRSFDLECFRRVINPFHPRYFKQFIPWGVPLKMTDYCVASEFLFCHYRPTQTGGAFLVVLDPRMCVPGRSLFHPLAAWIHYRLHLACSTICRAKIW
jgi:hypothetical protein